MKNNNIYKTIQLADYQGLITLSKALSQENFNLCKAEATKLLTATLQHLTEKYKEDSGINDIFNQMLGTAYLYLLLEKTGFIDHKKTKTTDFMNYYIELAREITTQRKDIINKGGNHNEEN